MIRFKLGKTCKYVLPYLLSFIISLPAISQITAPTTAPTSTSPTQTTQPAGNPRTTAPTNSRTNNTGTQQGNQTGNQPGKTTQQNTTQGNDSKTAADKGKATTGTDAATGENGDGTDQSKINKTATGALTPEQQAKEELRNKIFGYSIFADKNLNTIPDFTIATPRNYVVGPGDVLKIFYYNFAEASYELEVNRDGFISIQPRVGNVYVNGLTIDEIRKVLIDKFTKVGVPGLIGTAGQPARTKLMVTLGEVRTVKVLVTGEVINPGTYELSSLSSAFNALYLAGGPNEIGSFRDVRVVRNGKVVTHMDLYDFLMNGKKDGDIRVQDNDNIQVGYYIKRVEVTGLVKRPGIYELLPTEKLSDMINYAGGFDDQAYRGRIKIERITSMERKMYDVPEVEFKTFEMNTGDLVNVGTVLDRFENIVTIEGAVMRPDQYSLDNSPTLKQLISNAQGLREDAFTGRISVQRTRADLTIQNISVNYTDILNNSTPDLMLTRLDVVQIPSKFAMSEAAFISVQGEVNNPGITENEGKFPYTSDITLEDVLVLAGGFKESAYTTEVEVVRRKRNGVAGAANAQIAEIHKFNVNRDLSLNANQTNFPLLPFDQVIVRKSPNYVEQQSVFVEGEVLVPGAYSIINKNDKISDIIKRSGGVTELANPEGATLFRRSLRTNVSEPTNFEEVDAVEKSIKSGTITADVPSVKEESVGIQLSSILKNPGSFEDLIIQEGDIIRVPKRLETVQVIGQVLYPTTVKYGRGMAFTDYISQSGGFTTQSLRKSSYIKYPNGSVDRTRRFLFFNVYPKVQPGSEIYVPQRAAPALNTQQTISTATGLLGSIMTLVVTILAFRSIR
ncbi:SLBB domain-containing protein [Dyadobacter psychrotolerans]|uniref:Polysaccharide export protein n=1 Tax=Dyadobacter psychrotolerans TaxID=2541721 RepID=A0A4R5DWL5_9BACT|nr:SLBB domain-containing protein [Dyadobacter psychrotolerans]TDE16551.1 polysaccharide export protein [Dyadobacter psychrotolerans]